VSYEVFARKYRPQTFDDIVGQAHVARTLKNAVAQNRLAHAYLFVGPAGHRQNISEFDPSHPAHKPHV
jgi:DNA polymerase III subunit gamma/tau